jgi:tetratricopeptide (TPR) repeat protein
MMSRRLDSGKTSAPKSEIQWMRHAIFGMVCVLVIGIFAWIAAPGFLESTNSRAEDSYYNLLVQGFRAGQLNVKREAPPGLTQLADPYNPAVNSSYVWNERDPSLGLLDMSYYKGKLYLYFGVTPALVLFWPYVVLTGHYLPEKDAVVIFYALGFLVAAGLFRAVWRRYFPEASVWVATVGILTLGWAIGTLEVLSLWCDVNEVAMSCGFAFTMLALAAIWCALHEPKRQVLWLLLASLAYGLAIGSRPSLLFGVIILLMPVVQAWRAATESRSRRRVGLLFVAAVGPVMLIGLGLMLYNTLRFDNPFEFGWHYQLAAIYRQTTAQQFSLHYLWFNLRFYFLEPMRWCGHFPFLQAVPLLPVPSGYWAPGEDSSYSGILSNYPLVWLALAAPLAWRGRPVEEVSVLRWFVAAVFLLFVICASTLCLFFAANVRYELDFLPALMLLVVMGILGLERALAGLPVWRRIARWGWSLLLAYLVLFNILEIVQAHATINYYAGNFLLHQGRADEALEHFQKALAIRPGSAAFHAGLGSAFYEKKRMDEAIIQFQRALEIKPDFAEAAEAHNNLGYSLLQKGLVNEAITHFQKALEIKPGFAEAHNTLGDSLFQIGRVDEAIVQYQKAVEIKPDFAEANNNLGYGLFQKGRVNEAITYFQKAVEIKPDFAEAHSNLGYGLFQIGRVDEAIIQYQAALVLQPRSADVCERFGDALFRKGQMDEAIVQYQKAVEIKPDFAEAHGNLGYCFLQLGRLDEAIVHCRKAIELQPHFVQAYNNLGNAFSRNGMAAEAMACYQKAIELQPQFTPAQLNLAWMLATWPESSVRNGGNAVALAGKANELSKGQDPRILRTLAAAYAETGRFPEAVLTAKQALALAVAKSNTGLINELQTEIGLYQTNSPCRSTNY